MQAVPVVRRLVKEHRGGREDAKEGVGMQISIVVLLLRRLRRSKIATIRTVARPMDSGPVTTGNVSAKISCVMVTGTAGGVKMRNKAPVLERSGVTISLLSKFQVVVVLPPST